MFLLQEADSLVKPLKWKTVEKYQTHESAIRAKIKLDIEFDERLKGLGKIGSNYMKTRIKEEE